MPEKGTQPMMIKPVYKTEDGTLKGMSQAARDLKVTRQHLRLVLIGERKSKKLLQKVRELHPELLAIFNIA